MKKDLLLLLAYTLFWFIIDFILQINQNRTFTLVDDHTIISTLNFLSQHTPLDYIKEVLKDSERFRPLLGIHRLFYTLLFGTNIKLIGYYYLVLAGITSFFLHQFALLIGFSKREAIAYTILVLFGMQGVIWWVFDSSENIGILFMSIALYAGHKAFEQKNVTFQPLFWIALLFMSLSKESFVFILPFFAILYRKTLWVAILILSICVAEIAYIKLFIGTTFGYAGVDEATYSIKNLAKVTAQFLIRGYGIPLLLTTTILVYQQKQNIGQFIAKNKVNWIIIIVGVMPFLVLYAKSGINVGRYLLPLLVPQLYVLFQLLNQLKTNATQKVVVGSIILLFGYHTFKFVQQQLDFVEENKTLSAFYEKIESSTGKNERIVLLANPFEDFERAGALMIYLKSKFSLDRTNAKMAIVELEDVPKNEQLNEMFKNINGNNLIQDSTQLVNCAVGIVLNNKVREKISNGKNKRAIRSILSDKDYSIFDFEQ